MPKPHAGWLRPQLVLFSAAVAAWLPYVCAAPDGSAESGGPLAWFGIPLLAILAGNAAWRLHDQGKASTPLAGLGAMTGSALALLIWITPQSASRADEAIRVISDIQLAIGVLLIALQAQRLESPRNLVLRWVKGRNQHARTAGPEDEAGPRPEGKLISGSRRWAKAIVDVLCFFGLIGLALNTLVLALLVPVLVGAWGFPDVQPADKAIGIGLSALFAAIEVVALWALRQSNPKAATLAPPVLLLLTAGVATVILGQVPSTAPLPTAIAAVLTLLACRWYLRTRRKLADTLPGMRSKARLGERSHNSASDRLAKEFDARRPISKPWTPGELWISFVLFPILWFALGFAFMGLASLGNAGPEVSQFAFLEAEVLTLWIVLLYLVRRKGLPWSVLGIKPFPLRTLLVVPVSAVAELAALGTFNDALLPALPALQAYQASLDAYVEPSAPSIALLFLGSIVVAPIVEELLCRGFFFTGFRCYIGPVGAAVLSALLFSLAHAYPTFGPFSLNLHPSQALGAFLGGLVYAGMRHDSDSVFPSMLAHAAWNLFVIL